MQELSQNEGLVIKSTGSWYTVRLLNGQRILCRLKGKLKLKNLKVSNPITVGDIVVFELENEEQGIISTIKPRKNFLVRKSVHKTAHGSLMGSNIDQAVIMVTISSPKTSLGFIDRFLVSAETFRIPCLLVFNKQDLLSKEELAYQEQLINTYENIGYQTIKTSLLDPENTSNLAKSFDSKINLLAGHSGVGKSTLLNYLLPDLNLQTSEISEFASKGVHTTTFAEMHELNPITYIIDSPGINELGLFHIEDFELADYFPEMRKIRNDCKFNNCQHTHEPKCAIIEAVKSEKIALSRYQSYLSMLAKEDNRR